MEISETEKAALRDFIVPQFARCYAVHFNTGSKIKVQIREGKQGREICVLPRNKKQAAVLGYNPLISCEGEHLGGKKYSVDLCGCLEGHTLIAFTCRAHLSAYQSSILYDETWPILLHVPDLRIKYKGTNIGVGNQYIYDLRGARPQLVESYIGHPDDDLKSE